MEQYVGLDVSLKETSLCVVDQTGTTLWQGKCASTPECIAAVLARRAPGATRIGLESGLLSTWHWHALKALGLPVVCLDARHAKAALSLRLNAQLSCLIGAVYAHPAQVLAKARLKIRANRIRAKVGRLRVPIPPLMGQRPCRARCLGQRSCALGSACASLGWRRDSPHVRTGR